MLKLIIIKLLLISIIAEDTFAYKIPTPTLEILSPKGFRMSIPDEDGIVLFAFHGSINHPLKGHQNGDYSADIRAPVNGLWQYENTRTFIDPGDVLYYWIHVQYGNQVYLLLDKSVTIPLDTTPKRPKTTTTESSDLIDVRKPITPKRPKTTTTDSSERFDITKPLTSSSTQRTTIPNILFETVFNTNVDKNKNCILSPTLVRTRNVCKGSLIFEDNFNDLNLNKWKHVIKMPMDAYDADFVSFQSHPNNIYVDNGILKIVPSLLSETTGFDEYTIRNGYLDLGPDCTGNNIEEECRREASAFRILPPVVSAKIRTKDSFSFRYGRVEVRAKLTRGDWLFPLITLDPNSNYYGSDKYKSGQMRVAFIRGNEYLGNKNGNQIDGHRLSGGVVLSQGELNRDIWLKSSLRSDHLGKDFHNYSLTWTDESITLSVDGNDYATIRGKFAQRVLNIDHAQIWDKGGNMAPFDREFYLTLGVSAGGISDFPDGCQNGLNRKAKPWTNTDPKAELKFWNDHDNWYRTWKGAQSGLQVDFIRVYAL